MVIDMHIPDWDERFLSQFDPHNYVEMLKKAHAQSIVLYAQSHVGVFNYPTKVGVQHKAWKGRDVFGELVGLCHQNGIATVAYTSLIFDRWAAVNHPDWRIKMINGDDVDLNGRFGLACPNSPYRDYTAQWAEEMLTRYPVEGVRFDMTFWPAVCYCHHCRERFGREVGENLPEMIDWENPIWVAFQRKREEWLADFAAHMTAAARRARPEVSVEHQASTFSMDWKFGISDLLAPSNDFLQGDFYGDALQGSFIRKMLYNLSPNLPFGFETSVCVTLGNHTAIKPAELLTAKAYGAVAGQGAMIYIDGIDPVGTLNPKVYERIGNVLEETMQYDPYRGGNLVQDVALYFSFYSKYDPADTGKSPEAPNLNARLPHTESIVNATATLITHHIPYGVVTKRDLQNLSHYPILVLPNLLMMDQEEIDAIRKYVSDGGNLFVSRGASLITEKGVRNTDFFLADVFGVDYLGETKERFTYIAPEPGYESLMPDYSRKYPLGLDSNQVLVKARDGVTVLGKITLPYTDPAERGIFSSVHSNPPGIPTEYPAIVIHAYGKGKVIYSTASLESVDYARGIFVNLLKMFQYPFSFEADAPGAVEVTLFDQPEQKRFMINLHNFQKDLPNIPVEGARVRVRLAGKTPGRLLRLPDGKELDYSIKDGLVEFVAPRLETFALFCLEYE